MKFKNLLAGCLASAMFLSMGTSVFAAEVSASDFSTSDMRTVRVVSQSDAGQKTENDEKTAQPSPELPARGVAERDAPEEKNDTAAANEADAVLRQSDDDFVILDDVLTEYNGEGGDVTIPDYVTSIGDDAFAGCSSLTSVTIGNSVMSIGNGAFEYCSNLTSVTIGDSVESIGDWAFYGCTVLSSFMVYNNNPDYSSQDGVLYNKNKTEIVCYPNKKGREFIIPDSVTFIHPWAFSNCTDLTSITIPNSIEQISEGTFSYCTGLTNVVLPDSVHIIDYAAFMGCTNLNNIVIPEDLIELGGNAFEECHSLKTIFLPNTITKIKNYTFQGCSNLQSIDIPNNVTFIGEAAFARCDSLKSVMLPESLVLMYEEAFSGKNLQKIDISSNNRYYSSLDGVLYNKSKSKLIAFPQGKKGTFVIPDSVSEICPSAFINSAELTSVAIGNSVTSIGEGAFSGCSSLTSLMIPDSVTSIGDSAFYECVGLTNVIISNSVMSVGNSTFYGCSSLKSVSIGHSVANIDWEAFSYCSSLTSVTIPDSVTTVCNYAFRGCSGLSSVTIPDSVTSIGDWVFDECDNLKDIYYTGTQQQWNQMLIDGDGYEIDLGLNENVTIHYNYTSPLTISLFASTSDVKVGDSVTLKATHTGGNGDVQFKFYYRLENTWVRIHDFSPDNTAVWRPTKDGFYSLYVEAKDSSGKVVKNKLTVTVKASVTELKAAMTAQYVSPQKAGTTIRLTVNATGGTGSLKYKFYSECNGVWTKLWDYSDKNTYNWHATTVGTHTVYCDVKDGSGKIICSSFKYQIVQGTDFVADLNANRISGQYTGTEIRLLAGSSNGSGTVQYKFYVEKDGVWTRLRDFAAQDYFLWTPIAAGFYNVYVDVKDSAGKIASKRLCITIEPGTPLKVESLTADPSSPTHGNSITLTGASTGGEGPVTYKFYYEYNGTWVKIKDFSESKTATFTPSKAGTYHVYMDVTDGKKNTQTKKITLTVK